MIDSKAVIDPSAQISENVNIGPYSVIGANVSIDSGTWIGPHVVINGPARIGKNNQIFQFASVGEQPQDKKYKGEQSRLEIGDNNIIREFCTLNRGTELGGGFTKIGNNNLLMAYVHIAHDCIVGDNTIFSNNASLAGHVTVEDYASLGGLSGINQFCRIGAHSFLAGGSMIRKDIPPFMLVLTKHDKISTSINVEGLKRRSFSEKAINLLRDAHKILYRDKITITEAVEKLEVLGKDTLEIQQLIQFINTSERGILR